jgi:hypothetical protein
MPITNKDREILRERVVGYLAVRSALKFEAASVRRSLVSRGLLDFDAGDVDVEQALVFAEGLGLVKKEHADMGATLYWQATSEGVLAAERKGWNL